MSYSNQIICYTSPHLSLHVPFFFLLIILTHCYVIVYSFYYPPLQAYLQYKKSLSNIIHLSHSQIQVCRTLLYHIPPTHHHHLSKLDRFFCTLPRTLCFFTTKNHHINKLFNRSFLLTPKVISNFLRSK